MMKTSQYSDEYFNERQKILHSYFKDTIEILSESHSREDIVKLFESLSFPIENIDNASTTLTFDDYLKLIGLVKEKWDIPGLGLKLGHIKSIKNFGIYGYALMSSTSYDKFNTVSNQIFNAIYEPATIINEIVGDKLEISYVPKVPLSRSIHIMLMEQILTCGISLMKAQLPADISWENCVINCDYPMPTYANLYADYFPGQINFNQPVTQLCVPAQWLDVPLQAGNNAIYILCENKIDEIFTGLKTKNNLSDQVRYILLKSNFNDLPKSSDVAKKFNIAERTLHLRLSRENTSYRAILNEVRNELAQRYLDESNFTIKEIAFLLGYEHAQNFYRAFLKSNQMTPTQYRGNKS